MRFGRCVKDESAFEKPCMQSHSSHKARVKRKSKVNSAGRSGSPPSGMRVELAHLGKAPAAKDCAQSDAKGPILLNLVQER